MERFQQLLPTPLISPLSPLSPLSPPRSPSLLSSCCCLPRPPLKHALPFFAHGASCSGKYSALGDRCFDLANLIINSDLDAAASARVVRRYLGEAGEAKGRAAELAARIELLKASGGVAARGGLRRGRSYGGGLGVSVDSVALAANSGPFGRNNIAPLTPFHSPPVFGDSAAGSVAAFFFFGGGAGAVRSPGGPLVIGPRHHHLTRSLQGQPGQGRPGPRGARPLRGVRRGGAGP